MDGNTGNWIFEHGMRKMLHDKLQIIALNSHMHLLRHFDHAMVFEDGAVAAQGTPAELFSSHPSLMATVTGISVAEFFASRTTSSGTADLCNDDVAGVHGDEAGAVDADGLTGAGNPSMSMSPSLPPTSTAADEGAGRGWPGCDQACADREP